MVDLIEKKKILLRPPYQRRLVWSDQDRQLLVDSIVKDFDIGKFYLREISGMPYDYEVIDGQQRLDTLRRFRQDGVTFPVESGSDLANKKLSDLPSAKQIDLGSYGLDVVVIKHADDRTVREMFRRLQLGRTLSTGERLNAYYGALHDFVEEEVLKDKLFPELLGFKDKRNVYFEVASQMIRLSFEGEPCAVKYQDLIALYEQHMKALDNGKRMQFMKDLSFFRKVLEEDGATFHPDKSNLITLFLFSFSLKRRFSVTAAPISSFIKAVETARHAANLQDDELNEYNKALRQGTAYKRSLAFRLNTLRRRFLTQYQSVRLLDDKRFLLDEQRMAVYWRDNGKCRFCGMSISDKEFQAHHTDAWYEGGPTTVDNSLTACKSCHKKETDKQLKKYHNKS
jgi:hypothetical protein